MIISRLCACLGLLAGTLSMWETLSFSWDPTYHAPALRYGPTHSNYHAFREFSLSVGAALVILYVLFRPAGQRTQPLWTVMFLTALCYYGGWWLPWPLFGLHTPNLPATIDHLAATILTLTGVALAWRHFPADMHRD